MALPMTFPAQHSEIARKLLPVADVRQVVHLQPAARAAVLTPGARTSQRIPSLRAPTRAPQVPTMLRTTLRTASLFHDPNNEQQHESRPNPPRKTGDRQRGHAQTIALGSAITQPSLVITPRPWGVTTSHPGAAAPEDYRPLPVPAAKVAQVSS